MGKDCKDLIPLDTGPLTRMAPTNGITQCHRGSPSTHGAHMGREGGGGVQGEEKSPRGYTLDKEVQRRWPRVGGQKKRGRSEVRPYRVWGGSRPSQGRSG